MLHGLRPTSAETPLRSDATGPSMGPSGFEHQDQLATGSVTLMTTLTPAFTKERETLLITLYARALESRSREPILRDELAEDLVRRLDYDFAKLKITQDDIVTAAVRAFELDRWTGAFLASNPVATVLHLGCGLDSRVFRVKPASGVTWFDLDLPDVIELRRRLYPEREGYRMITSSVTEPDWLRDVPLDRPVWVVAEGLLMYLDPQRVTELLARLTARCSSGELAFDAFNSLGVRLARRHHGLEVAQASITWGIDDPHEIERQVPGLQFVTEFAFTDSPAMRKLPGWQRAALRLTNRITTIRRVHRLLRYQFRGS